MRENEDECEKTFSKMIRLRSSFRTHRNPMNELGFMFKHCANSANDSPFRTKSPNVISATSLARGFFTSAIQEVVIFHSSPTNCFFKCLIMSRATAALRLVRNEMLSRHQCISPGLLNITVHFYSTPHLSAICLQIHKSH